MENALADCNQAVKLDPKYADAYSDRGKAYGRLGQLADALSDFSKAIELNPKIAVAYSNRGTAYARLGQLASAVADYTRAIDLNPKYAEAYFNRGTAELNLGQMAGAGRLQQGHRAQSKICSGLFQPRQCLRSPGPTGECLCRLYQGHRAQSEICRRILQPRDCQRRNGENGRSKSGLAEGGRVEPGFKRAGQENRRQFQIGPVRKIMRPGKLPAVSFNAAAPIFLTRG